jgi:hypothetical protein
MSLFAKDKPGDSPKGQVCLGHCQTFVWGTAPDLTPALPGDSPGQTRGEWCGGGGRERYVYIYVYIYIYIDIYV